MTHCSSLPVSSSLTASQHRVPTRRHSRLRRLFYWLFHLSFPHLSGSGWLFRDMVRCTHGMHGCDIRIAFYSRRGATPRSRTLCTPDKPFRCCTSRQTNRLFTHAAACVSALHSLHGRFGWQTGVAPSGTCRLHHSPQFQPVILNP